MCDEQRIIFDDVVSKPLVKSPMPSRVCSSRPSRVWCRPAGGVPTSATNSPGLFPIPEHEGAKLAADWP